MKKQNIQDLRREQGLTQEQTARSLEITKEYLSMIERGERNPSDSLKLKIAKLYKKSISDIFLAIQETKCFTKRKR